MEKRTATECTVCIDEKGIIHQFDTDAAKIFGYKASEVLGTNISQLMPEPFRSNHDGYLRAFVQRGNDQSAIFERGRELIAIRKDGTPISIRIVVQIQSKTPGGHYLFRGRVRDLSSKRSLDRWMRKSAFEQYLFGLLYALTQGMSPPRPSIALTALCIDFLSILSFNLRPEFPWGPSTRGILSYFVSATSLPLLKASNIYGFVVVRIVWSIVVAFVLLAFIDAAYVAWAFKEQKVRFVTAVKFLRVFVSYAVSNLFVSILGILLFPIDCQIIGKTTPSLSRFPSIACWGPENGPIAGISIVVALVFTVLAWCVSYMPRDPHPSSRNVLAVSHSYYDVVSVFLRTIQSVVITFLSTHVEIIGAVNFLCAVGYLFSFLYFLPNFRPRINATRSGMYACILWSSICLIGVISSNDPSSELYSFVLVGGLVPSFIAGWWLCKLRMWWVVRKSKKIVESEALKAKQKRSSLCPVVHVPAPGGGGSAPAPVPAQPVSRVVIRGRSFRARNKNTGPRFRSELEVELAVRLLLADAADEKSRDPAAALDLMHDVMSDGMAQFPRSGFLSVMHALYSLEVDDDLVSGVESFEKAKGMTTTMPLRFIMYSHFKDDENKYQSAAAGEAGLGLVELVQLNKDQQMAKKHHLGAVKAIKQMWRALLPDKVDVSVLPDIMQRIYTHQESADKLFSKMLTKYRESPRMLRSYAMYLHDVKNDGQGATMYYHMADEVEERNSRVEHKAPVDPQFQQQIAESQMDERFEIASVNSRSQSRFPIVPPTPSAAGGSDADGQSSNQDITSNSSASALARLKRREKATSSQKNDPVFRLHIKIILVLILVFSAIMASFISTHSALDDVTSLLTHMHESGLMIAQSQRITYAAQFSPLLNHTAATGSPDAGIAARASEIGKDDLALMRTLSKEHLLAGDHLDFGPLQEYLYSPSIPFCYPPHGVLVCLTNFLEALQDFVLASETIFEHNENQGPLAGPCEGCEFLLEHGPLEMFDATVKLVELQRQHAESTTGQALVVSVSMQGGCIAALVLVVSLIIHPNVRHSCASYFQMYAILLKIPKHHVESRLHAVFHIAEDEDDENDVGGGELESYQKPDTTIIVGPDPQYPTSQDVGGWTQDVADPPELLTPPTYTLQRGALLAGAEDTNELSAEVAVLMSPENDANTIPDWGGYQPPPSPPSPEEPSLPRRIPSVRFDRHASPGDGSERHQQQQQQQQEQRSDALQPTNLETEMEQQQSWGDWSYQQHQYPTHPHHVMVEPDQSVDPNDRQYTYYAGPADSSGPGAMSEYEVVQQQQDGDYVDPQVYQHFYWTQQTQQQPSSAGLAPMRASMTRPESYNSLESLDSPTAMVMAIPTLTPRDKPQPTITPPPVRTGSPESPAAETLSSVPSFVYKVLSWVGSKDKDSSASAERKRVRQLSTKYFGITFIIVWILIGSMIMFYLVTQTIQKRQYEVTLAASRQGVAERMRSFLRRHSLAPSNDYRAHISDDLIELVNIQRQLLYGSSGSQVDSNLFRTSKRFGLYFTCGTVDPQCKGLFDQFQKLVSKTTVLVSNPPLSPFDDFCAAEVSIFEPVLLGLRADNDLILEDAHESVRTADSQQGIMFAVASMGLFAMYIFVFWPLVRVLKMEERMMALMLVMLPPSLVEKVAEIKDFLKAQF